MTTFDPANDPTATPPRLETIDPTIGLVREFEIQGSLWGRYEIRHEDAKEIAAEAGSGLTPGSLWEVGVRSYIYRVADSTKPFNESPNRLLSTQMLKSEFRFMTVVPPANAAICCDEPSSVVIGKSARRIFVFGQRSIARSTTLISSRTFPGQS